MSVHGYRRIVEVLQTELDAHRRVDQSLWTSYTRPIVQYFVTIFDNNVIIDPLSSMKSAVLR